MIYYWTKTWSLFNQFSSTDFGDNIYINIGVFGIASFTANLILTFIVERFRRLKIAKISFFFMFVAIFSITVNFYQEEHSSNLIQLSQDRTIKIENRFNRINNNYTQLKQNAHRLGIDVNLILNKDTLKKKVKSKNNFRLWNGIVLKYSSSFAYHMVFILCVELFPTIIRQFSIGLFQKIYKH